MTLEPIKHVGRIVLGIFGIAIICTVLVYGTGSDRWLHSDKDKPNSNPPIRQTQIDSCLNTISKLEHELDSSNKALSNLIRYNDSIYNSSLNNINKKYDKLKGSIHSTSDDGLDSIILGKRSKYQR